MKDLQLLSSKLGVSILGCVRYSPCEWLPKMDYLKTEDSKWFRYDIISPPVQCETEEDFLEWIYTERNDDWWEYRLGKEVQDSDLIKQLNNLLTTQSE